jgi:membrane associated rhomboid family serine protease
VENAELVCVRTSSQEAQVNEWALVLASAFVPHRVDKRDGGFALVVPASEAERAHGTLAAYDQDGQTRARTLGPAPEYGPTLLAPFLGVLMVGFFAVTGPWTETSLWHDRGSAWADKILDGEVWRLVTALTLHADLVHALGNAVVSLVFVGAIARWLGPGVAVLLFLASGTLGNALTALVHRSAHISVGASTAVFGASGVLLALQVVAWRQGKSVRHKPWVFVGATLALFAMLGLGQRVDVFAHAFGLLSGALFGAAWALTFRRPLSLFVQGALAVLTLGLVLAAWSAALP